MRKQTVNQTGFTIIELMIATTVLSVLLLIVTAVILGVGHLYYKGVSLTQIQDNSRVIVDDIAQNLQQNDQSPVTCLTGSVGCPSSYQALCIGDVRYSYILYEQLVTDTAHVLWRDTIPSGGSCKPVNLATVTASSDPGGVELVTAHARLTNFSVTTTSPYTINVGMAFGDSVLLCDSGTAGDCTAQAPSTHLHSPAGQILCKSQQGQEFCGTTSLSITVSQRLTGS